MSEVASLQLTPREERGKGPCSRLHSTGLERKREQGPFPLSSRGVNCKLVTSDMLFSFIHQLKINHLSVQTQLNRTLTEDSEWILCIALAIRLPTEITLNFSLLRA